MLEEARAGIRDEESERNRVELVRALQNQPRNQVKDISLFPCTIIMSSLSHVLYRI